jgi:hypothetical protein
MFFSGFADWTDQAGPAYKLLRVCNIFIVCVCCRLMVKIFSYYYYYGNCAFLVLFIVTKYLFLEIWSFIE